MKGEKVSEEEGSHTHTRARVQTQLAEHRAERRTLTDSQLLL